MAALVGCSKEYSADQIDLARKIGAAFALSKNCTPEPFPMDGVLRVLAENGLTSDDITGETELTTQLLDQGKVINALLSAMEASGKTAAEVTAAACKNLHDAYGPSGTALPGLVD